jgi:predicted RecB family endonuclease
MTSEPFEPSEEDIESAMLYKKHFDSEHATREEAISMLKDMNSDFHRMAHDNPEKLLELQHKVDRNKNSDN